MLTTYPSETRRAYAHFSQEPVFILDYGYLVYRRGNPNTDVIRAGKSFDDLRGLLFLEVPSDVVESGK